MRALLAIAVVLGCGVATYVWLLAPRDQYAIALQLDAWLNRDFAGSADAWIAGGDAALAHALPVAAPLTTDGRLDPSGIAWRFRARAGQRISATVVSTNPDVFVDLFRGDGMIRVASGILQATWDVDRDTDLLARVQPKIGAAQPFRIAIAAHASLLFPVAGAGPAAVQSGFGASRDAGARRHEGIDIFARRGTAVLAATDGWITGATTNRLGGNVVWIWSPRRGIRTYYAHLDRQAVTPGERVHAGELVGYVGNTGNARTTPPHLHFGVYRALGGAVDPLPYVCDAPCGERLMHRPRPTAETEQ